MKFQAFARFNGGFRFSSRPPHGRRIYEAMKEAQGDTYNESFEGRQSARIYAAAMSLAAAQYQADRAIANANPLTATELLPQIERDYQLVPGYLDTLDERRKEADSRRKITRGPRRESIEDALRSLLGVDFIEYRADEPNVAAWPSQPGEVGVFAAPGARKKMFRLDEAVAMPGVERTLAITLLFGESPLAGESYTVDPDTRNPSIEKVTLVAASAASITATFAKPHPAGALASRPHPVWISDRRHSLVRVTPAAATDPETRRRINEVMTRMVRGVSRWNVVSDQGTFLLGSPTRGILNATELA